MFAFGCNCFNSKAIAYDVSQLRVIFLDDQFARIFQGKGFLFYASQLLPQSFWIIALHLPESTELCKNIFVKIEL
jgi:hypothetical protein